LLWAPRGRPPKKKKKLPYLKFNLCTEMSMNLQNGCHDFK
jgi:hypothetical protein